ncbi:hypothetical protein K3758_04310 [Sulfitobacter sp. W002]|uniref:hypothetical protein n=1 Tax=Sulfitobacter sp. W002 TaxID=2867024 RepID=UPI0021A4D464|nr:hypothetical protein [Sulfitobacter sp. W002]UWR30758.1 hypothetical protein K3758_04310 [Sulfitobacter sp. W002]
MMNSGFSVKEELRNDVDALQEPDAFAYFVDPSELSVLVQGWPEEMRLLLCMDAGGLCEFVVFHNDEEHAVFDRVADILDRPVGSFAVSPEVEGHPCRRLLFSEENALLKAIQESKTLEETAADYLINYNFAREEGLDFDELMRQRPELEQFQRVSTNKIFPIGTRKRRKLRTGPPEGYMPSAEVQPGECFYVRLEMWLAGGRMRIAASPEKPLPMVPTLVRDIAFRDDFASVYIPRDTLAAEWRPKDNMVIDIPAELFPAGFSDSCERREVKVSVMPRGIFVEFGAHIDVPPAPEPELLDPATLTPQPPAPRKSLWKSLHIPLIAVAGLGVTGLFSTIIAQTTGNDVAPDPAPKSAIFKTVAQMEP